MTENEFCADAHCLPDSSTEFERKLFLYFMHTNRLVLLVNNNDNKHFLYKINTLHSHRSNELIQSNVFKKKINEIPIWVPLKIAMKFNWMLSIQSFGTRLDSISWMGYQCLSSIVYFYCLEFKLEAHSVVGVTIYDNRMTFNQIHIEYEYSSFC